METEEYRDGQFEYATASALIEEIIDRFNFRAYIYLESDNYDNVLTETQVHEDEDDEIMDEVQLSTLKNLIADILKDRENDDRNELIATIYDIVHNAIHIDDEPEYGDDLEEEM